MLSTELAGLAAEPGNGRAAAARPATRGRALIIEEDRALLEQYTDALLAQGYSVSAARSVAIGARLLARQSAGSFDVVVTETTSKGDAELLRTARETGRGVPIVFVTGAPSVETAVQALEMGALHYLVRPFTDDELLRCVDHATRIRRLDAAAYDAVRHLGRAEQTGDDRALLERRLTAAIGSLYVVYQPILRVRDRSVFGWEALLRTRDPALAGPVEFLHLAERLGRTQEVSRAVRTIVAGVASRSRGIMFFVNLHPDDLLDDDLYDPESALAKRAADVVLEITELRPFDVLPDVHGRLAKLRALGFRIAIDDLGAGYSTLSSLAALQPEFVKLDRSLVAGIDHELAKTRLVGSIVRVCGELGRTVIAEGVETEDEQTALVGMGCGLVQGYLFRTAQELGSAASFPLAAGA